MALDPRAIAVNGVGYEPAVLARNGLWAVLAQAVSAWLLRIRRRGRR